MDIDKSMILIASCWIYIYLKCTCIFNLHIFFPKILLKNAFDEQENVRIFIVPSLNHSFVSQMFLKCLLLNADFSKILETTDPISPEPEQRYDLP